MKLVRFIASLFLAFGFLFISTPASAAQTGPVNITCQNGDAQGTYTVGWDNSNQFFANRGDIAQLYCEGGYSPLGQGATYVSDDLADESLRYYNGIIPEPTPTPEVTPTPSPEPTPEPTPEVEPTPTPEPQPSPEPAPEPETTPVPETPSSPEPQPQPSQPVDPTPPVVEPEPVLPSPEPPVIDPTPEPEPEILPEPETPSPEPTEAPTEPEKPIEPPQVLPEPEQPLEPAPEPSEPDISNLINLEPSTLTEQQVEALVELALEAFETAEPGSAEYEAALEALALAAQADDVELPAELAAIPLLGDAAAAVLEVFNNLGNVGADMSPQVRETSEEVIIAAVIVGQVALTATTAATAAASITRK